MNKYDPFSLKDAIDSEIVEILEDHKAVEVQIATWYKIILGILSGALGYYSYFKLNKFPESWFGSLLTIFAYMLISAIYYYIENYIEKDCFIEITSCNLKSLKSYKNIKFSSKMEDFGPTYTYIIEAVKLDSTKSIEIQRSIGQIFDSEGYLHKDKVREMFDEGIKMLNTKKK